MSRVFAHTAAIGVTFSRADERHRALDQLAAGSGRRGFRIARDLLGSDAEAEDAVQEALARACESHGRLRDPDALRAWFFRVLSNLCMRALRRRRVRRVTFGWIRGSARSHIDPVTSGGDRALLLSALELLPSRQRAALVLRYGHDLSVVEIAALLGVGTETVKTHIARGLRHLREKLDVQ